MRKIYLGGLLMFLIVCFCGCSHSKKKAQQLLTIAEQAIQEGNYPYAKQMIDSIKASYPKAFDERKKGLELTRTIRLLENRRNIAYCDSLIHIKEKEKKELVSDFQYVKEAEYDELGTYYPKNYLPEVSLQQSGLRSGVSEKGMLFIESVWLGAKINHHCIKIITPDAEYAETKSVTDEGLNYSFTTQHNRYEIVRYTKENENGVAAFIYAFNEHPLNLTFIGTKSHSIPLSVAQKKALIKSFELSTLLQEIEKLKFEKEKSETLIKYLEQKK